MRLKIFSSILILIIAVAGYGVQTETEWVKLSPSGGGFSVLLPHEPKFEHVTDPANNINNYRYSDIEEGYGFICEYFDIPGSGADTQVLLDAIRDGVIRGANATKLSEEKIALDGYPGRELELSVPVSGQDVPVRARIILVGNRVYCLSFLHMKGMDALRVADLGKKFFSSFKLIPRS